MIESQRQAGAAPEASASPRALQEKDEVDSEFHSKVPEVPASSESPTWSRGFKELFGFNKS